MTGIGIGQNMYGIGANMGGQLGSQAQRHGEDQAGLKYGEFSAPGEQIGKVIGAVSGGGWGGS